MATYQPGSCLVLVTEEGLVMTTQDGLDALPAGSDERDLAATIDALRVRATPFAAVRSTAGDLEIEVAGQFSVDLGEDRYIATDMGPTVQRVPWTPRVTVNSGHAPFGPCLPVLAGAVLASTVEWAPPGPPQEAEAPEVEEVPEAVPGVSLVFTAGRVEPLEGVVVLGRAPQVQPGETALVVDDPHVSGTHLRLELRDTDVVATDFSSNGTLLADEAGAPYALGHGVETFVPIGWAVRLSEDSSFRITDGAEGLETE